MEIQLLIETMSKVTNNSVLIAYRTTSHIATYDLEQARLMKVVQMFSQSLQKSMNILH